MAALTVTAIREKTVDFTVPFKYATVDMIMRKETVKEMDFLQFMMPFKNLVWVMVLVFLAVMTSAIFTLNYFSPYGYKDENGRGTSSEFNLFNSFWFALACMLQQGGDNTPRGLSGTRELLFNSLSVRLSLSVAMSLQSGSFLSKLCLSPNFVYHQITDYSKIKARIAIRTIQSQE